MDRANVTRGFLGSALLMLGGTALAQAIPLLTAPLLTRLYGPEQFGALATFVGAVTVLSVVATLRMEPAIVLPQDDGDAANLVAVALCVTLVNVILLLAGSLLGKAWIHDRWPAIATGGWLPLVAPTVLCVAIAQTASSWANRRRGYRSIVGGTVLLQGGSAAVSLLLGTAGATQVGLLAGRFGGHLLSATWLAGAARHEWRALAPSVTYARSRAVFARYRQFPQFNLPYSLIGTASREFLLFALTAFNFPGQAGYYGLARTVLYAPVSFLSASLSQVFYKEAADSIGTPGFEALAGRLVRGIVLVMTPGFAVLAVWGPDLFAFVFGTPWREAGLYATIFLPAAYLFLFSSWPERLFEVTGRQRLSLAIQVAFDVASVLVVLTVLAGGRGPTAALIAYTAIACGYHCTFAATAFRVAGFQGALLWRAGVLAALLALGAAAVALGCRLLGPVTGLATVLVLTAVYTVWMSAWLARRYGAFAGPTGQESTG